MIKTKDAVITVKAVHDGDQTDTQVFIELILQKQQKLRTEPRNENNILKRMKTIDGDSNREYNYITPDAVYTA